MKKVLVWAFAILLIAVIGGFVYLYPRMPIINGYAAKMMCSCRYVANRSMDSTINKDLGFFPITLASVKVNDDAQSVTSTVFGMRAQTAYYNPQMGCALMSNEQADDYLNVSFGTNMYTNVDSGYWPYSNILRPIPEDLKEGSAIEEAALTYLSEEKDLDFSDQKNTNALLVYHNGSILYEYYAPGFDKNSRFLGWSMGKSVMNAWLGALAYQGKLKLSDKVPFDHWANDERKKITWNNLLNMNSGLDWTEDYSTISEATQMLYQKENMVEYAGNVGMEAEVGTFWEYASGSSNLISGAIRNVLKEQYHSSLYDDVFGKIGANSFMIETDAAGNYVGSSYPWATARDYAKFGILYLNKGKWGSKRVFSENWTNNLAVGTSESNGLYAAHFWKKSEYEEINLPSDTYAAHGFQGQRLIIVPSKDLVVVRLGNTMDRNIGIASFLETIVANLPETVSN